MKLGIDLHNIRDGGGISYISNLLQAFDPAKHGFDRICLFGSREVLDKMPSAPHIEKRVYPILSRSLPFRLVFLFFMLTKELHRSGCSALYSPGGIYFGSFRPFATISRNMLPFESEKWAMYPWGFDRVRLHILRMVNAATFRRADRMIFLTHFASAVVGVAMGRYNGKTSVIPHGVNRERFRRPADQHLVSSIPHDAAINLVYPSRLEPYKHQIEVIRATAKLRHEFPNISIVLCGPANKNYLRLVEEAMAEYDPNEQFIHYIGEIPNSELPSLYSTAHLMIFASSCENLPNTMIEAFEFGLPIVCSEISPMPEVANGSCRMFDPCNSDSIENAICEALKEWDKSLRMVEIGSNNAKNYSWGLCADKTFHFIRTAVVN